MSKKASWKDSIVYQIYPRSFNDSNSDGVGDIQGITQKLPYLQDLGINVIWLSPVYSSPNDDNGYDISNYYDINPDFGTMSDMHELIGESKKHGIKILMDLVVNHTSDEHEWFKQAKSDKKNKYHDYYIWSEGSKKPNNWKSFFQGSTWEWNKTTNQNYLHLFSKKQPDLNWQNREMRNEIYTMMRWWLDKGIAGFRLDVFNVFVKPDFNELAPGDADSEGLVFNPGFYADNPGMHDIVKEMNAEVFSKYDCLTVGEGASVTPTEALQYVHENKDELNMVFHFELVALKEKSTKKIKEVLHNWLPVVEEGGWNSNYLSNHDNPRQVSAFGDDKKYLRESATLLAALNFCLPGTPYIYQGEEIGMTNMVFDSLTQFKDIETINGVIAMRKEGMDDDYILNYFRAKSRDNSRTPLQWNNTDYAGFSNSKPWLDVNANYSCINIETQTADHTSVLNYYKKLISLRKKYEVMTYGDCTFILENFEHLIAIQRSYKNKKMVVLLNRSGVENLIKLDDSVTGNDLKDKYIFDNIAHLNAEKQTHEIVITADNKIVMKAWQSIIILDK